MKKISLLHFFFISPPQAQTFKSPLLPAGANPRSINQNGYYYYTHKTGVDMDVPG